MTDRRALWSNSRVAHSSLKGQVKADHFTDGADHHVCEPVTALRDAPNGNRDRELLYGQTFCVLDVVDGVAFGMSRADGYAGYVDASALHKTVAHNTHRVSARQTTALGTPDFKATKSRHLSLSLGSECVVTNSTDRWATIATADAPLYVPRTHLTPLATVAADPVSIAETLVGTPYVWGGNSAFGIDCSGLVQIACRACGIPCPGDSDQQQHALGKTLPEGTPYQRGDVLFWTGHVGWVVGPDTLLHANAFHMAVAFEPLQAAISRIQTQGDGPVTRHARLTRP